jgi:hypothetical protein
MRRLEGLGRGLRGLGGGAGAVSDGSVVSTSFGALTIAGAGGIPVTGTSISSGDASGHWQISGGRISPSPAGDTANLNLGPYSLVLNDDQEVNITIAPDVYSVRDATELSAAVTAAASNKTIRLRAAATGIQVTLTTQTKTGLTITGEAGHSFDSISQTNCTGITWDGCNVVNDNSGGSDWAASTNAAVFADGGTFTFQNGSIDCGPTEGSGLQTTPTMRKRFGGVYATDTTLVFDGNTVTRVRDGIVTANGTDATITNNSFSRYFEDCITGTSTDWTVDDNTATIAEGQNARRYNGTITGTITVGMLLTNGLTGDSKKIILVDAVAAGYVEGIYNNYAIPAVAETYSDGSGNQIVISSISSTSIRDGIHGDFFQPLLNGATQDHRLYARRNTIIRSLPYDYNNVGQEQNVASIFAEDAGGSYDWNPCDVRYNVCAGGSLDGMTVQSGKNGQVAFNTVLWTEGGISALGFGNNRINISRCENLRIEKNVGDNNAGGVVTDGGSHVANVIVADNTFVDGDNGSQLTVFNANLYTYPQELAFFAPQASSSVDTAGSGALTTAAAFRSTTLANATLTSPTGTQTGQTTADLSVSTTRGDGTLFAAVYPTASTPSAADVVAGTGATWTGSTANPGTGSEAFSATGLTAGRAYKAHFVHRLGADLSTLSTSAQFTTASGVTVPSIVAAADDSSNARSTTTLTISSYTPGTGSNRKVFVFAGIFNSTIPGGNTISATYDGVAMELVGSLVAPNNFENIAIFQMLEADLPGGAANVVVTSSNSVAEIGATVFTVKDAKQEASSGMTFASAGAATANITPPEASCLVLGFGHASISADAGDWTAGLTRYSLQDAQGAGAYFYPPNPNATSTILVGTATHGNSSLTCTHNMSSGRPLIALVAVEPV